MEYDELQYQFSVNQWNHKLIIKFYLCCIPTFILKCRQIQQFVCKGNLKPELEISNPNQMDSKGPIYTERVRKPRRKHLGYVSSY